MNEEIKKIWRNKKNLEKGKEERNTVSEEPQISVKTQIEHSNNKFGKSLKLIVSILIIIVIIGVAIYNTPQNRLNRNLDLGNKYLAEMNYEQAVLAFEKSIAIDERCIPAYVGTLEAYINLGNKEEAQKFYEETLTMLDAIDTEYISNNRDDIKKIYLMTNVIYEDEEIIVEILEKAISIIGEDTEIKEGLIKAYLKLVLVYEQKQDDEKVLEIYDRLIELDKLNPDMIAGLERYLEAYIERLMLERNYDEIRALSQKYSMIAKNINFETILAEIKTLEEKAEFYEKLMEYLYSAMQEKRYDELRSFYYSDVMLYAFTDISESENKKYIYLKEGGQGVGIYNFSDDTGNYYTVYYGEYKDGMREGQGVSYITSADTTYLYYDGSWSQDKPNGQGEIRGDIGTQIQNIYITGTFKDGLYHGNMMQTENSEGVDVSYQFTCENGIPIQDKKEEFRIRIGVDDLGVPEELIMIDYNIVGTNSAKWIYIFEGQTLGVWEFGNTIS